jgi:hypothetical protein
VRLELLKEGGSVSTTDRVAETNWCSPQKVVRCLRYPRWQFGFDRAATVHGLEEVLSALSKHDAWMQNVFFLSSNSRLNGSARSGE